jgi:SP family arabinose:H+ symporter-like MFS transporter
LTHWVFAALVANFFPLFTESYGGTLIFGFFAVMMVAQLAYVAFMMPETKGANLEDIEQSIIMH